jgi:hypothetical protein
MALWRQEVKRVKGVTKLKSVEMLKRGSVEGTMDVAAALVSSAEIGRKGVCPHNKESLGADEEAPSNSFGFTPGGTRFVVSPNISSGAVTERNQRGNMPVGPTGSEPDWPKMPVLHCHTKVVLRATISAEIAQQCAFRLRIIWM